MWGAAGCWHGLAEPNSWIHFISLSFSPSAVLWLVLTKADAEASGPAPFPPQPPSPSGPDPPQHVEPLHSSSRCVRGDVSTSFVVGTEHCLPAPLLLLSLLQLPSGSPWPPQPQRLLLGPPALPGRPLLSWLPFAPPPRPDSSDFFLLVREREVFDSCLCHYSSLNAVVVLCYCQITSY